MITFQELHLWKEVQLEPTKYNHCTFCDIPLECWFNNNAEPAMWCVSCDMILTPGLAMEEDIKETIYGPRLSRNTSDHASVAEDRS